MAVFITAWLAVNGWQLVEIINLKIAVAEMRAERPIHTTHEKNQVPTITAASH